MRALLQAFIDVVTLANNACSSIVPSYLVLIWLQRPDCMANFTHKKTYVVTLRTRDCTYHTRDRPSALHTSTAGWQIASFCSYIASELSAKALSVRQRDTHSSHTVLYPTPSSPPPPPRP